MLKFKLLSKRLWLALPLVADGDMLLGMYWGRVLGFLNGLAHDKDC